MTIEARLDAFGLVVGDMAASLAFYRALGLAIPDDADGAPHVEVDLGGGIRLMFDTVETVRSFDPDWAPPAGGHRVALAFRCPDPDAVDALHARLVALGHPSHREPWDAFWGQRYAVVHDPDGNSVDLYAALPG
ncbi:MAG TPA: VOC family protein [Acidimicrobiales bacterium]|nr:VOC family protein [Acidimicrobiales bacterium]